MQTMGLIGGASESILLPSGDICVLCALEQMRFRELNAQGPTAGRRPWGSRFGIARTSSSGILGGEKEGGQAPNCEGDVEACGETVS